MQDIFHTDAMVEVQSPTFAFPLMVLLHAIEKNYSEKNNKEQKLLQIIQIFTSNNSIRPFLQKLAWWSLPLFFLF